MSDLVRMKVVGCAGLVEPSRCAAHGCVAGGVGRAHLGTVVVSGGGGKTGGYVPIKIHP